MRFLDRLLSLPMLGLDDIIRFWMLVQKTETCWLWEGSKSVKAGYGRFVIGGQIYFASRVSWLIHYLKDPGMNLVLYECHNPPCINPDHLFLGSHKDNSQHSGLQGRYNRPGITNSNAALWDSDILEIRELGKILPTCEIARMKQVNWSTINAILKGKTWRHL